MWSEALSDLAIRAALEEVTTGHEMDSEVRMRRSWRLLMLLPGMLLNRLRRGGRIPRRQLENRFRRFHDGEWIQLLSEGHKMCCTSAEIECQAQEKAPS